MSGGFFRGTSADQDTRFSNKQAKLLKSQKFAPELEHLVDMTKVKMDVMRPWIAHRVTELLGFEDEVLINFIYGLLDGKEVNGKEVQISLTGFMEKNTGKFMKELWALLLSAQKNASGVPQQFLDAKEEETRKKKAETDRIASEIEKKKEKEDREIEQEKTRKMDGEADISRGHNAALEPSSKNQLRASSIHSEDEKETAQRNGSRRIRVSRSPHSADHSTSPRVSRSPHSAVRVSTSPRDTRSRSISKSFSNSRSYSGERRKSRSMSESPQPRERSISSGRAYHSPSRRSVSPRRRFSPRRSHSPSRRRSSYSRRRSISRSFRRSPSPVRRRLRSPLRHRSRTPFRRRSRSPIWLRSRSPVRYRSRSPMRRRSPSPVRRRSRSLVRRRSPSPYRRRSPSPVRRRYRRSPSTPRHRSPSPIRRRSPITSRRRLPTPPRRRSLSPEEWSSPSPVRHLTPSQGRKQSPKRQRSPVHSPRERIRTSEKFSPVRHARPRENVDDSVEIRRGPDSVVRRPPISLRSPQRDPRNRDEARKKAPSSSPSPYRSQSPSESPQGHRRRNPSEDRRSYSPYESPVKQANEQKIRDLSASPPRKPRDQKTHHDSLETSGEEEETNYARGNGDKKFKSSEKRSAHSSTADDRKDSLEKIHHKNIYSPERPSESQSRSDSLELRRKDHEIRSEKASRRVRQSEVSNQQQLPVINEGSPFSVRKKASYPDGAYEADEKIHSRSNDVKGSKQLHETEPALKSTRSVDEKYGRRSVSSGSQESDKHRPGVHDRRKHKRSERKEVASDDSYDSEIEDRKEAKRRRKEEKRLRKEERRRRREERRRRREERRAEKLKAKSIDNVDPSSDYEKNHDGNASDGERIMRMETVASDAEETESEKKKLEIELRKKALESLRAKKGVGH